MKEGGEWKVDVLQQSYVPWFAPVTQVSLPFQACN